MDNSQTIIELQNNLINVLVNSVAATSQALANVNAAVETYNQGMLAANIPDPIPPIVIPDPITPPVQDGNNIPIVPVTQEEINTIMANDPRIVIQDFDADSYKLFYKGREAYQLSKTTTSLEVLQTIINTL